MNGESDAAAVDGDPLLACAGLSEQDLADVVGLLSGSDIVELDLALGKSRLLLRRSLRPMAASVPRGGVTEPEPATLAVTSPLVGVFHPLVRSGQQVRAGQPIGAIEALGMPTSIDAPQGGSIEEVLVDDGRPVEYGQPLLVLRRSPSLSARGLG